MPDANVLVSKDWRNRSRPGEDFEGIRQDRRSRTRRDDPLRSSAISCCFCNLSEKTRLGFLGPWQRQDKPRIDQEPPRTFGVTDSCWIRTCLGPRQTMLWFPLVFPGRGESNEGWARSFIRCRTRLQWLQAFGGPYLLLFLSCFFVFWCKRQWGMMQLANHSRCWCNATED